MTDRTRIIDENFATIRDYSKGIARYMGEACIDERHHYRSGNDVSVEMTASFLYNPATGELIAFTGSFNGKREYESIGSIGYNESGGRSFFSNPAYDPRTKPAIKQVLNESFSKYNRASPQEQAPHAPRPVKRKNLLSRLMKRFIG